MTMLRHAFTFSIRISFHTERVCCHICQARFNVAENMPALFVNDDAEDGTQQHLCDDCAGQHVPELAALALEERIKTPHELPSLTHSLRFVAARDAWRKVAEEERADRKRDEVFSFVNEMERRGVLTSGERQDILIAAGIHSERTNGKRLECPLEREQRRLDEQRATDGAKGE
jgi:hypothetical protein